MLYDFRTGWRKWWTEKGFQERFCYGSWVGWKELPQYWDKGVVWDEKQYPLRVGSLKGIVVYHEEPWNCLDIWLVVGDLSCCKFFVQVLKIEMWECKIFLGLWVRSENCHNLSNGLKEKKSNRIDFSWSIM